MQYYVVTDTEQRIVQSSADTPISGATTEEMPEGFDPNEQSEWRKVESVWVHDPLPEAEPEPDPTKVLQNENKLLAAQVKALEARGEFIEDCIAEMAMQVYGV